MYSSVTKYFEVVPYNIMLKILPIYFQTTLYAVVYAVLRYIIYFVGVRKVPLYVLRVDRQWEVGREKECQSRERERDGKRVGR